MLLQATLLVACGAKLKPVFSLLLMTVLEVMDTADVCHISESQSSQYLFSDDGAATRAAIN